MFAYSSRPPSPPPQRAYRSPIALQTRIGGGPVGVPAGSIVGAGATNAVLAGLGLPGLDYVLGRAAASNAGGSGATIATGRPVRIIAGNSNNIAGGPGSTAAPNAATNLMNSLLGGQAVQLGAAANGGGGGGAIAAAAGGAPAGVRWLRSDGTLQPGLQQLPVLRNANTGVSSGSGASNTGASASNGITTTNIGGRQVDIHIAIMQQPPAGAR